MTPDIQLLSLAVDQAPVSVVITDRNGNIQYANPKFTEVTGYTLREIVGKNPRILKSGEQTGVFYREMWDALGEGRSWTGLFHNRKKSGELFWEKARISPVRDNTGQITHYIGIKEDVTEHLQAQQDLEELSQRYAKISAMLTGVIYQFKMDADGKNSCFPYASEGIRQIYRVSPEEVREDASKVWGYIHPDDRDLVMARVKESAQNLTVWEQEYRTLFPDGTVRWLLGQSTPERLPDGGTLWHGFIADVTEQKQLENQNLEIERRLLHAQKLESLGVLAGGIAHDFNNLLMAMQGHMELAMMDLKTHPKAMEQVGQAIQAVQRAADLSRQMLAYSGKGKFDVREIHLNELVDENIHILRAAVPKTVNFLFKPERRLPLIRGDAGQVQQVIMNLITNACEAMEGRPGDVVLGTGFQYYNDVQLWRSRAEERVSPGHYVWMEVRDQGCGMSRETLEKLFDPFFTTKFTGRGLGMSAVQGIIKGHRGAILVDSGPGEGTCIRVLFPSVGKESAPPVQTGKWDSGLLPRFSPKRPLTVLVVDDEEPIRGFCAALVKRMGGTAFTASCGEEALRLAGLHADEIRLVILDLMMPGMDGAQAYMELKKVIPECPVVVCSGYGEQEVELRFAGKKPDAFLQKPYSIKSMSAAIDYFVAKQEAEPVVMPVAKV